MPDTIHTVTDVNTLENIEMQPFALRAKEWVISGQGCKPVLDVQADKNNLSVFLAENQAFFADPMSPLEELPLDQLLKKGHQLRRLAEIIEYTCMLDSVNGQECLKNKLNGHLQLIKEKLMQAVREFVENAVKDICDFETAFSPLQGELQKSLTALKHICQFKLLQLTEKKRLSFSAFMQQVDEMLFNINHERNRHKAEFINAFKINSEKIKQQLFYGNESEFDAIYPGEALEALAKKYSELSLLECANSLKEIRQQFFKALWKTTVIKKHVDYYKTMRDQVNTAKEQLSAYLESFEGILSSTKTEEVKDEIKEHITSIKHCLTKVSNFFKLFPLGKNPVETGSHLSFILADFNGKAENGKNSVLLNMLEEKRIKIAAILSEKDKKSNLIKELEMKNSVEGIQDSTLNPMLIPLSEVTIELRQKMKTFIGLNNTCQVQIVNLDEASLFQVDGLVGVYRSLLRSLEDMRAQLMTHVSEGIDQAENQNKWLDAGIVMQRRINKLLNRVNEEIMVLSLSSDYAQQSRCLRNICRLIEKGLMPLNDREWNLAVQWNTFKNHDDTKEIAADLEYWNNGIYDLRYSGKFDSTQKDRVLCQRSKPVQEDLKCLLHKTNLLINERYLESLVSDDGEPEEKNELIETMQHHLQSKITATETVKDWYQNTRSSRQRARLQKVDLKEEAEFKDAYFMLRGNRDPDSSAVAEKTRDLFDIVVEKLKALKSTLDTLLKKKSSSSALLLPQTTGLTFYTLWEQARKEVHQLHHEARTAVSPAA